MKTLFTVFAAILLHSAFAQQELMHIQVDTMRQSSNNGENLSRFIHTYGSLLYTLPPAEQIGVRYGQSYTLNLGIRYKKKISGLLSVVGDVEYNYRRYRLTKGCTPVKPDPETEDCIRYDKELFTFNTFKAGMALRINFDPKRGNIMGTYIDLGGAFEYVVGSKYTFYTSSPAWFSNSVKVKYNNLSIISPYNYYAQVKFGRNRYVLTATYRLSDVFDQFYPNNDMVMELPRLNVGLEVGLY